MNLELTLDEEAELVVDVYRSPPIESLNLYRTATWLAGNPNMFVFNENMWKLGAKKRRIHPQP
jgi:hypothetical protein